MVSGLLTGVRSSSPMLTVGSESVVWPPTPQTHGHGLRVQREAQAKRQQQQNHPHAVAMPRPGSRSGSSPPSTRELRLRIRNRAVSATNNEPLQLGSLGAAVNEIDHCPEPQQDNDKGGNANGPVDQSSSRVYDEDLVEWGRKDPASTTETLRSYASFYRPILRLTPPFFFPPCHDNSVLRGIDPKKSLSRKLLSTKGSGMTRSKSSMKHALDLTKLKTRVVWKYLDMDALRIRMEGSQSATLWQSIISVLQGGYLPVELRSILDAKLILNDTHDTLYAKQPVRPLTQLQLYKVKHSQDEPSPASLHLRSLLSEYRELRTIKNRTREQIAYGQAEARWNDKVHAPMLELAVLPTPTVGITNVTRAIILPKTSNDRTPSPPADYVMVLKPQEGGKVNLTGIDSFLEQLDFGSFSQSDDYPLQKMPSGVFIGTKANREIGEAKIQLGIRLASWFGRVSQFPSPEKQGDILKPPVIPILIVDKQWWELWFAFDTESAYEVCGGVRIGDTSNIQEAYRLLAVLRVIADWMAKDFAKWVDDCLKQAGV